MQIKLSLIGLWVKEYFSNKGSGRRHSDSPLRNVMCLAGEPHQSSLNLNPYVKGHQEIQSTRLAAFGQHVADCHQSRKYST